MSRKSNTGTAKGGAKSKQTKKQKPRNDRAALIMEQFRAFPGRKFSLKTLASQSGGNDREGRVRTFEIVHSMVAEGVVEEPSKGKFRLAASHLPAFEGKVDMLNVNYEPKDPLSQIVGFIENSPELIQKFKDLIAGKKMKEE